MLARHFTVGAVAAAAIVALAPPHRAIPALVWNPTASAPRGLYRVEEVGDFHRGQWMLVRPPAWVAHFAAARGYLPAGVPLIKRVAAVTGDRVCAVAAAISINGQPVARRLTWDSQHRPLLLLRGGRVLGQGQEILLNTASASFDSRYFGPVPTANNLGRLEALWTF